MDPDEDLVEYMYSKRKHEVITVGRIDDNKNQRMLIDAFAKVWNEHQDWKLTLYGDGPMMDELQEYVKTLDSVEVIAFPGRTNNVADKIAKSGIFVLCSDTEGMPNTLLEAMALGIPSISTDCPCGGPKDIIEDGVNGLLVPVRDTEALRKALLKYMDDEAFAVRVSGEASKIQEKYAPEVVNGMWEKYLCGLMN